MSNESLETETPVLDRIADAVSQLDLRRYPSWRTLSNLSRETRQDAIAVDPNFIEISGDAFSGPMDVYVELDYVERRGGATLTLAEGFPGIFHGHLGASGEVVIDRVEVDTRGFIDG